MVASNEAHQRQCLTHIHIGFWLVGFFFREYVWIGSVGYLLRIDVGLFFFFFSSKFVWHKNFESVPDIA